MHHEKSKRHCLFTNYGTHFIMIIIHTYTHARARVHTHTHTHKYKHNFHLLFLTSFSNLFNLFFCLQWKKVANRKIHWRLYENLLRKKDRMYICFVKYYAFSKRTPRMSRINKWNVLYKLREIYREISFSLIDRLTESNINTWI